MDLTPAPDIIRSTLPPAPQRPAITAFDDPDAEQDREEAFDDEALEWNGRPLHAFSVERYSIFVSQRRSMGSPDLYDSIRDSAAFFADALRILFLCATDDITLARLRRDPEALQSAIDSWATTEAPTQRAAQVIRLGYRLFNSAHLNRAETLHSAKPSPTGHHSGN